MQELVLLKLGGSLITDKGRPYSARLKVLADLASQIAVVRSRNSRQARGKHPDQRIVLGHGSGSFGHSAASQHGTREGLQAPQSYPSSPDRGKSNEREELYWRGFAEVGYQAAALNRLVMQALRAAGVPALAFPPSAGVTARDRQVAAWDLAPLQTALAAGLLPVIYGDVVFDTQRGGTILSTEDLMTYLARQLRPGRILLAGLEQGVWADFPERKQLLEEITPQSYVHIRQKIGPAAGTDVTGGMLAKVEQMLALTQDMPGLQVRIFSGQVDGSLERALGGEALGTLLRV